MLQVVNSVAEMTALRDRDEVGEAVSSLLFATLNASVLEYWDAVTVDGDIALRKRIRLPQIETLEQAKLRRPRLIRDFEPDLAACLQARAPIELAADASGMRHYLFPVVGHRGIAGILRIGQPHELQADQRNLVDGLLRIYHNHLSILDYSEIDELTGLLNRKTFDDHFGSLVRAPAIEEDVEAVTAESQRASWLAVADIDHFKKINDRFGHLLGDEVIVLLARKMKESLRETDPLFRCGGEEFVVLLDDVTRQQANSALERFRSHVESFAFPQVGKVTISIGLTRIADGDNAPTAFGRADQALYFVKQNGRNQVHCYEDLVRSKHLTEREVALNGFEFF